MHREKEDWNRRSVVFIDFAGAALHGPWRGSIRVFRCCRGSGERLSLPGTDPGRDRDCAFRTAAGRVCAKDLWGLSIRFFCRGNRCGHTGRLGSRHMGVRGGDPGLGDRDPGGGERKCADHGNRTAWDAECRAVLSGAAGSLCYGTGEGRAVL